MPSMNKVILLGRLTRDPNMRYTASGTALCEIGLAVNRTYKDKASGNHKEETCFVDITVWGKSAENCAQYLAKGREVLVEGRLKFDSWEMDGQKRSKLGVVAENVQFLSKGKPKEESPAVPGMGEEEIPF